MSSDGECFIVSSACTFRIHTYNFYVALEVKTAQDVARNMNTSFLNKSHERHFRSIQIEMLEINKNLVVPSGDLHHTI